MSNDPTWPRQVTFWGNFGPPASTENHLALSLESLGVDVVRCQEGDMSPSEVAQVASDTSALIWVQTGGLAARFPVDERQAMLDTLKGRGVPTVFLHLDRWIGLTREGQIASEPCFRCDYVATADGGHQAEWAAYGIPHHRWFPPAVVHTETGEGTVRPEYMSDVGFVGSWRDYGHPEWWPTRRDMLEAVRKRYRRRFVCWPQRQAVRGRALNDLYRSMKVVVGDSCLAGGVTRYCSDRIPESLGRGAALIHPRVEGVTDGTLWTEDEHLLCYDVGDHDELIRKIEWLLAHDEEREALRRRGMAWTVERHTYRLRMAAVLNDVFASTPVPS